MNTTLNFFRATPPASPSPRQRHALAKAYRRALRLAEHREWLAIEPRARTSAGAPRTLSQLPRLACLSLGVAIATASVGALITRTPVMTWLLDLHLF
jgi:hypothetical protein